MKYYVYIHDPTFYIQGFEPLPIPGIKVTIDEGIFIVKKFISVTKHTKMNQMTKPCNEDLEYDFQQCLRNSLARKVGCKLAWDLTSSLDLPVCSEIDQIRKFEMLHLNISFFYSLEQIIQTTECIPPCTYQEYKIVSDPEQFNLNINNTKLFYLAFADNKLFIQKEMELYSLISLVSDIGGALGLFLGLSFVMVWDGAEAIIRIMLKYMRGSRASS